MGKVSRKVPRTVDYPFFDEGPQRVTPGTGVTAVSGTRDPIVRVMEIVNRDADLLEMVRALQSPRRFTRRLHGRQEQRHQDPNDGNDDQ